MVVEIALKANRMIGSAVPSRAGAKDAHFLVEVAPAGCRNVPACGDVAASTDSGSTNPSIP